MEGAGADRDGIAEVRPKPGNSEAVISFTTKLPVPYQVPEDQLVVPAELGRYGLSEVVNRLLSLEKPVPFDFLVEGEFLRTSITQYLQATRHSSEQVLCLEYVLALSEPEQSQVDEVPDWISGIVPLQGLPSSWFAAVSYDGTARLYDGHRSRLVVRIVDVPLTSVAALPSTDGRSCRLVTGGKDGSTKCCTLQLGGGDAKSEGGSSAAAAGPVAALGGRDGSKATQAVAAKEDGTLIASAGWDQEICIWNADDALFASPEDNSLCTKRKAPAVEGMSPKFTLQGHTQVVTRLLFGSPTRFPFSLLSASWDCSVRVWDIAAAECVCNWTVARAATDLTVCPIMPPQIATAHEDGHVSIWDIRAPPHPTVKGAVALDSTAGLPLTSAQAPHRRLVSQVAWCPEDALRIASVGHDGRLCILDPRSPKMPLQSVQVGKPGPSPTKLLCLAWLARDMLAVGGSDGRIVRVTCGPAKLPSCEETV